MAKHDGIFPKTPLARPKFEIYTPKGDDKHPHPFHEGLNGVVAFTAIG